MRFYPMSRTNRWALTIKMMGYSAFITGNVLRPSLLLALATMPGFVLIYKWAASVKNANRQRRTALVYPPLWRSQPFSR